MAIVFFRTEKESRSDTWRNNPRHPVDRIEPTGRFQHGYGCPRASVYSRTTPLDDDCSDNCGAEVKIILYEGKVLTTRERNGYDDSDWYAVVWDEQQQRLKTYEYATTRFGGSGSAGVDATDEVKAKAAAWLHDWVLDLWLEANATQTREVKVEREVEVVSGRKAPQGTRGIVQWVGKGNYGRDRARIHEENGTEHWLDACHLRVVHPERYLLPWADGQRKAQVAVERGLWHYPFAYGSGYYVIN